MEEGIKDLINSYRNGLQTYFDALPTSNPEAIKAKQLLADMEMLAEKSSDYSIFMESAQNQNYFNEVIACYSKLGMELYKSKPKSNKIPTPSEIAKGYHFAYDAMGDAKNDPDVKSVYERVFKLENESASGPEFIMRMEEEDLFLKMSKIHLIKVMRSGLETLLSSGITETSTAEKSLGIISNPQMEHYFESMQKKMEASASIIEMEINAFREAENSRFSNLWDSTFLFSVFQSILSPLISFRMTSSEEHKKDTRAAYEFVCNFYGFNWDELFEITRIWDFFEKTIYGGAKDAFKEQNITSAKALQDDLKKYLVKCVSNIELACDKSKQVVNFRGKEIKLTDVHHHLKSS
jgi:hypothetical protein